MIRKRIDLIVAGAIVIQLCAATAGCGSEVTQWPPEATGGGTTATGNGGTGAAGGTAGHGGAAPATCGGEAGLTCGPQQWCDFEDGFCGGNDSLGRCLPRPEECTEDCPGVCGCDREFYCNPCMAQQAGVDVAPGATCGSGGAEYRAYLWPAGMDHAILLKADYAVDRCIMLFADWPMDNAPGFVFTMPDGWGVSHAVVTDAASDCDGWDPEPTGTPVNAAGGAGTISWTVPQGLNYPCELDIDAVLSFPSTEPWVPATAILDATDVHVEGGCM